jgi:hypothetical protein
MPATKLPPILLIALTTFVFAAEAPKPLITLIGNIDYKPCSESSGVVASRKHAGVFWTHCDSGNDASIYAITREGKFLAEYQLNVKNDDWEDIATDDDGHLYIGDIGNNGGKHAQIRVHRVDEPDPANIPKGGIARLKVDKTWKISYPDVPFDAESLFIYKEHGYIVSKLFTGLPATIYRFPLHEKKDVTLEKVVSLPIHSPATAADISPDGKRIAVLSLAGLSIFPIDGEVANAGKVPATFMRFIHPSAEGACFAPDGLLVTAESREIWLFVPPEPAALEQQKKPAAQAAPAANPPPVAAQTAPARNATPQVALHSLAKMPTIDGKLDDWDLKANELTVKAAHRQEPTDKSARAWAGWTDKGIYLAAIVPADGLAPLEKTWYSGDAVELFFGNESPDRSSDWTDQDDRCYVGFAKSATGSPGEFQVHWPRHDDDKGPAGAQAAGQLNQDGTYQLELFLPAAALSKEKLDAGAQVRFNISILSKKPRRNWYVGRSNADGCWMGPLNWAVATLQK